MNSHCPKFSFNVFFVFILLASLLGNATPAQAAQRNAALPVERLLNADGMLDLSTGYSGELDITNFDVSLDPALGPTFKPLASPNVWNALGTGLNNRVNTIAISGADVYAGGTFTDAGGDVNADRIAKFSGGVWSALGATPFNNTVDAIAVSGADVYAGGRFTDAGGDTNADYIAKFSGGAWSALGATPLNNGVLAIAISGADVYAGGAFTDAGGDANADYIAKFSGSAWSALGTTPLNDWIFAIAISSSDVYAGGDFTNAGGDANADRIAKFSGGAWSALGATPLNSSVIAIAISGSDVYAGGNFTNVGGDANADYIAKWNGSAWSALGATPLNSVVNVIAISGGDVYAGGLFTDAGGDANADGIAKFSGGAWSALGATPLSSVSVVAISGGDVYAGGSFTDAGGDANADYIARFEIPGATITVNTSADELNSDGDCSLREAIEAANTNSAWDNCGAGTGGDTIVFDNALGTATVTLGSGDQFGIAGANGLTINGGGDITISGGDTYRLFFVASNTLLTLNNLTLTNGKSTLYNGSAISVADRGEVVINHSSLLNNYATQGGAIYNIGGKLTITNSTIANSFAITTGGAIFNQEGADVVIKNSTLSNNWGQLLADGIYNSSSSLVLTNVIIANSPNGDDCVNTGGAVVTGNNNLIEAVGAFSNACGLTNGVNGNIIGSDPSLGSLTGSLAYLPLTPGSLAINAGDDATCVAAPINNTSQNGVTRPQGTHCDIGSYEKTPIFADVSLSYWSNSSIERLYNAGITGGCTASPLNYCPTTPVTRAQMAIFLLRGMHGSTYTPPAATGTVFNDVPLGTFGAAWIEQLAAEGITSGCGGSNYCPNTTVSRAQMAIFLVRAKHGVAFVPPTATGIFLDVPVDSFGANFIEQLVTDAITSGCGNGNFCPNTMVKRDSMAVFLVKTFNLP